MRCLSRKCKLSSSMNKRHPFFFPRNQISFREPGGGRLDISVGAKTPMGKTVDEVILEMTMPKGVLNVSLTASQGKYSFEPTSKLLIWNVGKIEVSSDPSVRYLQNPFESGFCFYSSPHILRLNCACSSEHWLPRSSLPSASIAPTPLFPSHVFPLV